MVWRYLSVMVIIGYLNGLNGKKIDYDKEHEYSFQGLEGRGY